MSEQKYIHPKYAIKDACPRQEWVGDDTDKTPEQKAEYRFSVKGKNVVSMWFVKIPTNSASIVTGGARGMGFDSAYAMLEHGATGILLLDVNDDNLQSAKVTLKSLYPDRNIQCKVLDVVDPQATQDAVAYSDEKFDSVDIVLAFAGIASCASVEDHTPEHWNHVININSSGSFYTVKYFGEKMIKQGTGGSVVMIASIAGHGALYPQPQVAYNASKHAVRGLMVSFATEWAQYGIRVNSISPGFMDTIPNQGEALADHRHEWYARMPMARLGERGSLNGAVMLLASQAGSYITGSDLFVDGGTHACIV